MTYRQIEAQVGIIHANLLDLNHYLQALRSCEISRADWDGIVLMLTFLRKHLNKPLLLPRSGNPEPRSQP